MCLFIQSLAVIFQVGASKLGSNVLTFIVDIQV